jgi:hypothetical protein
VANIYPRGVGAQICNPQQEWKILASNGGEWATVRSVACFVPLLSPFVRGKWYLELGISVEARLLLQVDW